MTFFYQNTLTVSWQFPAYRRKPVPPPAGLVTTGPHCGRTGTGKPRFARFLRIRKDY